MAASSSACGDDAGSVWDSSPRSAARTPVGEGGKRRRSCRRQREQRQEKQQQRRNGRVSSAANDVNSVDVRLSASDGSGGSRTELLAVTVG